MSLTNGRRMENFGRQQSGDIRIEKGRLSRASCAVQRPGIGEDNWWKAQNRCLHHCGLAAKSRVVSRSALRRPRQQTQEKADRKNARTLSLHPCSRPHRGALLRRLFSRKRPRLTRVDSQSPPPAAKSPSRATYMPGAGEGSMRCKVASNETLHERGKRAFSGKCRTIAASRGARASENFIARGFHGAAQLRHQVPL